MELLKLKEGKASIKATASLRRKRNTLILEFSTSLRVKGSVKPLPGLEKLTVICCSPNKHGDLLVKAAMSVAESVDVDTILEILWEWWFQ